MKSQRVIYTKTIRKMHTDFVASRDNINVHFQFSSDISHVTLHHPQREKNSHAFVLNAKTSIQGINTYRNTQSFSKHYSVTEFLNSEPSVNSNNFPECNDKK